MLCVCICGSPCVWSPECSGSPGVGLLVQWSKANQAVAPASDPPQPALPLRARPMSGATAWVIVASTASRWASAITARSASVGASAQAMETDLSELKHRSMKVTRSPAWICLPGMGRPSLLWPASRLATVARSSGAAGSRPSRRARRGSRSSRDLGAGPLLVPAPGRSFDHP